MTQKADLREAMLSGAKSSPRRLQRPLRKAVEGKRESQPSAHDSNGSRYVQPSRQGKKPITGFFPPNVRKQLKLMTVEQDTTIQDLMGEAFNDLFAKYGKPEIAPTNGSGAEG